MEQEDPVIGKALTVLENIQENCKQPSDYGKYVDSELSEIMDAELVNEAKHEINNILYKYKKAYINKYKSGIVIDNLL